MIETLHLTSLASMEQDAALQAREAVLHDLLPYDYDYAKSEGLIDMYHYDPETGEDGLLHTLAGNLRTGEGGAMMAEGFHHEPSAEAVWKNVTNAAGEANPTTYVDRTHLENANGDQRAQYREFPFEPYQGQVVVNGLRKLTLHRDPKTNETKLTPIKNTMFPRQYDALAVMQAVRAAYDTRDVSQDVPSKNIKGEDVLVAQGSATLMDGESQMPIRMILDAETKKIRSAIPITKRKPGIMKLTEEQADDLIYGPLRRS